VSEYRFVTRWFIRAPIDRVFAEIDRAEDWPSWWRGVLAVQVLDPGGPDGLGKLTRNTWRSVLPYTLVFDARLVEKKVPTVLAVEAFGELQGSGRWEFATEGDGTTATYYWNVKTNKWWMTLLAPLARPIFSWNHDIVMRWGGQGLARRLGTTFTER
jgi:hypothetical protein